MSVETERHCYESMFVLDLRAAKKDFAGLEARLRNLVERHGGEVVRVHPWGEKKFAYEIRKQKRGYYLLMHHRTPPEAMAELRRDIGLMEEVLRQLHLRLEEIPAVLDLPSERPAERAEAGPSEPEASAASAGEGPGEAEAPAGGAEAGGVPGPEAAAEGGPREEASAREEGEAPTEGEREEEKEQSP